MDTHTDTDRIEKEVLLKATRARVWRALTSAAEFGRWFGVELAGEFVAGARLRGRMTDPEWSHLPFELTVEQIEPERLFSYRWHPFAIEAGRDYSGEPTTLVEFELSEAEGATRLKIVESGFDALPPERRADARRSNSQGWAEQGRRIARHVHATG